MKRARCLFAIAALAVVLPGMSAAQGFSPSALPAPQVPVSAFALPANLLDPSRLHVSTSVSVGSGFGSGASALSVTRLSYDFAAPLRVAVSLGNAWGAGTAGGNGMFLEGLNLAWQPTRSMMFQVQYQNLRSPLQFGYGPFGASPTWGR